MIGQLLEMARFGSKFRVDKKEEVDVEIHGGIDRIYPPHIHIYHSSDRNIESENKPFNIEINFAKFLSTKKVTFCKVKTSKKVITDFKNENSNKPFMRYVSFMYDFLYSKPSARNYLDLEDNIAVAIKIFNDEANLDQLHKEDKKYLKDHYDINFNNISQEHKIVLMMIVMEMKIHNDFKKYFSKETQRLFPAAFNK